MSETLSGLQEKLLGMKDERHLVRLAEIESDSQQRILEIELKKNILKPLNHLFIGLNIIVFIGVSIIIYVEIPLILENNSYERLVTPAVIMSIVGGTTVQLGTIVYTFVKGLTS